jgi:NAD(P)-dependent dehydrogenase (short-subunit alcohol dehydrogenase family)
MQAALPHLISAGGAVVSVLSPVAVLAHPYTAAYTASKAGLAQMTKALAAEFFGENVRINAVAFGGANMGKRAAAGLSPDLDPRLFQKFSSVRSRIELNEIADVIAFLVSDAARGFHGSCVTIDNGISLG